MVEGDAETMAQDGATATVQSQEVVSYPSLMIALRVLLPTRLKSGVKTAEALLPEEVEVTIGELETAPFNFQVNASESALASFAASESVSGLPAPVVAPVKAGVGTPHVGGEFFTTVQVCSAKLVVLLAFSLRVFAPLKSPAFEEESA